MDRIITHNNSDVLCDILSISDTIPEYSKEFIEPAGIISYELETYKSEKIGEN